MFFKNQQLEQQFNHWMDKLNNEGGYGIRLGYGTKTPFTFNQGKKFIKVIEMLSNTQRCVFAFVDNDGNIYKPAGWAQPSKYVRAHLWDDKLPLVCGDLYA